MIERIIQENYPTYEKLILEECRFVSRYYKIDDKFIFVPYDLNVNKIEQYVYYIQKKKTFELQSFDFIKLIDDIVIEIATYIQAGIPRKNYLNNDIYLLISYDKKEINIKVEDVLRVENDKFCCRKIILTYDSNVSRKESIYDEVYKQFKLKFMFNSVYKEVVEEIPPFDEVKIVQELLDDGDKKLFDIENYSFAELSKHIETIYKEFNIV